MTRSRDVSSVRMVLEEITYLIISGIIIRAHLIRK